MKLLLPKENRYFEYFDLRATFKESGFEFLKLIINNSYELDMLKYYFFDYFNLSILKKVII